MIGPVMNQENTFTYTYRAPENLEVLSIRRKYLPPEETKLEELKRLDSLVQNSGVMESLCTGIGGALVFGLGMCLAMEVIGHMVWLGVILGLLGMGGMFFAYPVYRACFSRVKSQHTPRILQLAEELSGNIS